MLTSTITTSINEIKDYGVFLNYPNPTTSFINIHINSNILGKTFTLRNSAGQTILTGSSPNPDFISIDFSSLENGVYFVTIDKKTFKIIKQ
jgi:hypothetical protein